MTSSSMPAGSPDRWRMQAIRPLTSRAARGKPRAMLRMFLFTSVVAIAACGGKKPATSTTTHDDHAMDGEHKGEHEGLPPTVTAFHDKLAPLWHADAGP